MAVTGTLIPASNFKVRKVEGESITSGVRIFFSKYGYVIRGGWGLWDVSAQAWVAGTEVIEGVTVTVPWTFSRKNVAQRAMSEGLYGGYSLWTPDFVDSGKTPVSHPPVLQYGGKGG